MALKEAWGRWDLVAVDNKDNLVKTFGLDRMEAVEISKTSFKKSYNINIQELFFYAFGIINDSVKKPEKVLLSLSYEQGQYLKTYPLYQSQRLIKETCEKIVVELDLLITFDFVMELQSFGAELKVLKPKALANQLMAGAKKIIALYN